LAAVPASTCTFCDIITVLDVYVVHEGEVAVAFLDHRPVFKGHVLLVPYQHYETLTDFPDSLIEPLFTTTKNLARAIEDGLGADGTFVAINNRVSQSVPHLHVHIVPRRRKDGLRGFFWPRTKYAGDDEMREYATKIRSALED
jgi:histidine triad (HIT) family protein